MITEKDIEHTIKTCEWRHTGMKGKDRTERYVICKYLHLPCPLAISEGRCTTLQDLFKTQNDEQQ